ncbi:MerB-like organometallic lyase SaoL [Lagierella sp.]|uniref:MerB-like organometallic lyase SaoL n=1 Tax=Lagierella sp. TaxID=2849657 RepID=UPI00260FADC5|nr:MerB-like organometallic lyase SaoL [Lagierella sp.]
MKRTIELNGVLSNEDSLTSEEMKDRIKVLNLLIEEEGPLPVDKCNKINSFDELVKKGKFVLNEDGTMINFAYPISALPTAHRVTLDDGRGFFSMCAIDSLGSYFTFWQNLEINSSCSVTGEPIVVKVEDGKISYKNVENIHCIHVNLNEFEDWSASC